MICRVLFIIPAEKPPGMWLCGAGIISDELADAKLFESAEDLRAECRVMFERNLNRSPMALVLLANGGEFLLRPDNLPPK